MTRDAVTPAEVAGLAYSVFGLRGHASALPGEHDRNFVLTGHAGERHVLKLHPPGADPAGLDLQDAALSHLSAGRLPVAVPRVVPPSTAVDGARVRALSWVGGTPAALAAPLDAHGMASLGRAVAAVDAALASFQHPAMHRAHPWSMLTLVRDPASPLGMAEGIPDPRYRADVVAVLQDLPNRLAPALEALPGQVIHNDANDHNVLLDDAGRVCGLIDFGDLCWAPRVCGLAVACAYAMQGFDEPVTAVPPLVAGYHEVAPLAPAELAVLFDLIRARLALSACHAVRQHRDRPDNDYLLVSQDGVRALLRILAGDSAELAHLRFRAACGYDAVPAAHAVRAYLLGPDAAIGPVCPTPLAGAPVLDWSRGATGAGDPPPTRPAIGRYLEDRAVYAGDAFATGDPDQRRSLHLGVDIFLPAGEPVLAALDGVVHDVAWRPEPYDWGGIVVLAHRTADGVRFYTLSAHLDRGTAQRLTPGAPVVRGDVIGYLGTAQENGGWPPHLHLQLLTTTLDRGCAAYGVAAPGERALWESVSPDPNLLLGLAAGVRAEPDRPRADLLQARATSLSRALSLSYARPLTIVDGAGAHLYAADGRDYLDMVNNVCHVGHAHPRVVAAIAQQAARLNTNTRYLHPLLVSYARRLAATCPDPLSVVFLVNSGSEANDLALRLARAHTKARDVLVLDHAYHGNLSSLIDISPYKFAGPGGLGRPEHTQVCELPDAYRGRLRHGEPQLGPRYAADVAAKLAAVSAAGRRVSAFVAEAMPGVAGQVELPPGYLAAAYAAVRAAGGVCVADEIQVGFGRFGSHFWGFQAHGVVPDIVTAGKPIGNGHPLGAVITTPEIARSFETGMEYFNTFGGNPVSCAAGLAVLDVLTDERLQARAAVLGGRLLGGLRELAQRHPLIGDVRGRGLFLGVELVADRITREPAPDLATRVVESALAGGVLLSTDGPYHNVLKLKPPLALTETDVDLFLAVLDRALDS